MSQDQWLIRTADNWIAGPYTKQQVCEMIRDQKLSAEDEVCPSNGFWFYLSERQEVVKQLGADVGLGPSATVDEVTATGIEDEETDPELKRPGHVPQQKAQPKSAPSPRSVPQRMSIPATPVVKGEASSFGNGLLWVGIGLGIVVGIFILGYFLGK